MRWNLRRVRPTSQIHRLKARCKQHAASFLGAADKTIDVLYVQLLEQTHYSQAINAAQAIHAALYSFRVIFLNRM
jgi:hypothetical protein